MIKKKRKIEEVQESENHEEIEEKKLNEENEGEIELEEVETEQNNIEKQTSPSENDTKTEREDIKELDESKKLKLEKKHAEKGEKKRNHNKEREEKIEKDLSKTISFKRKRISNKNYDDEVVKLIDEVKIFNDEDDDLVLVRKRRIWPIFLTLIIMGSLGFGIYYFIANYENKAPKKAEPQEEVKEVEYRYEKTEDGIVFYADDKELVTYSCSDCEPYLVGQYEYFSTNPTLLAIVENDEVFLYDYTAKEIVSDKYTQMKNLKDDDETVAFIVANDKGIFGVIDLNGDVIVPIEYEELAFAPSGGDVTDYSYEKNLITAKKNGKWGIINFNGEEVIPFEYDDIYYNGYDAVVVYDEGLWYLHDLENNELIKNGYNMMIPINSYVFAVVDNIFYILNYDGELIIEREIPAYLHTFRSRNSVYTPSFKITENGTVVDIYIMRDEFNYDEYKFNTVNGELTEIIQ